jgi:hypothetical protein
MMGIITKVIYIVYKERLGRALMNEIKENNYDMNILSKGNIARLWVLSFDFISMIACDSDFSLP